MQTSSVWQFGAAIEREIPLRLWAARRSVLEHAEGTCHACPEDDATVCEVFRCSIRRLIHHGGLGAVYRAF